MIVSQITGAYQAKDDRMIAYQELVQTLQRSYITIALEQILKGKNNCANALSSYSSTVKDPSTRYVLHRHIKASAISKDPFGPKILLVNDQQQSWITPILDYI